MYPETWEKFLAKRMIHGEKGWMIPYQDVVEMVEHYFSNGRFAEIVTKLDDADARLDYAKNYIANVKYEIQKMYEK